MPNPIQWMQQLLGTHNGTKVARRNVQIVEVRSHLCQHPATVGWATARLFDCAKSPLNVGNTGRQILVRVTVRQSNHLIYEVGDTQVARRGRMDKRVGQILGERYFTDGDARHYRCVVGKAEVNELGPSNTRHHGRPI